MSKTIKSLLVLIGLLLFVVGFLLGQQGRRSKFDKYFGPATAMEAGVLRANISVMKTYMSIEIPVIYYNYSCDCFTGYSTITSEMMNEPATQLRTRMMGAVETARSVLERQFPPQ